MITIAILEDTIHKHRDELDNIEISTDIHGNKAKCFNLCGDRNDSGHQPLQNKTFPEKMCEATIKISKTSTTSVHDTLKAHKVL